MLEDAAPKFTKADVFQLLGVTSSGESQELLVPFFVSPDGRILMLIYMLRKIAAAAMMTKLLKPGAVSPSCLPLLVPET